ncbi:MAG: DUF1778 domain-containing protein [Phyllobacteriaceae bacterium]|nr:DUF1778 domain-containing protein [Phyllobacteriaceae bacterium]
MSPAAVSIDGPIASTKSEVVNVRFEPRALETLRLAARSAGVSLSAYLTMSALEKARLDLADQRVFAVSADVFEQVSRMINAPSQPHAGLEQLLTKRFDWLDE